MTPDLVASAGDQVIHTLTYVAPGFVALKIFYLFGLRSRRSDLEWTIWSLVTSVVVGGLSGLLPFSPDLLVVGRFLVAIALAGLASFGWAKMI